MVYTDWTWCIHTIPNAYSCEQTHSLWDLKGCCRQLRLHLLWPWPSDPKTLSVCFWVQIHMWPNFGGISCNSYEHIEFAQFFGSLLAVTLTFDFLTIKYNQHIYEAKYVCDQKWVKFPSSVFEIWCSQSFQEGQIQTHSQTDTPENRMNPAPKVFGGRGIIMINIEQQWYVKQWYPVDSANLPNESYSTSRASGSGV